MSLDDHEKLPSGNLPTESRLIPDDDGVRYTVTRLGWWAITDALHELEAILGPSLRDILDADGVRLEQVLDMEPGKIGEALTGLLRRATDERGKRFLEMLGAQTMVEPEGRKVFLDRARMNLWFGQHPDHVVPWLRFCLEVQFLAFFAPLKTALASNAASTAAGKREAGSASRTI